MFSGKGERNYNMKIYNTNQIKEISQLKVNTPFYLSGKIFSARDKALTKLQKEKKIPKFLKNTIIYHAGPTEKNEKGLFSCGPTTSKRMDIFLDYLFENGVFATIGKGERDIKIHKKYKKIYLLAIGGLGALYGSLIKSIKPIMYKELGSEAIYEITIDKFPLIMAIDKYGKSIY